MISVEEANAAIAERTRPLPPRIVALDDLIVSWTLLAEDVVADIDLPPFRKALMDGYAVRSRDIAQGTSRLRVVERIVAGQVPKLAVGPGEASEIMTGAPLPDGADAIVIVEHSRLEDGFVILDEPSGIEPGKHWMEPGREMRRGEVVLKSGTILTPLPRGLLASVGKTSALVIPAPSVAIVPTGDELVEPDRVPGPGQIRNSNATMLRAFVTGAGGRAEVLGIAPDDPVLLKECLRRGLESDVLLISGGVSAGKLDLVPETLASLGVERVFHRVRMKPGKPIWFGVGPERDDGPGTLVFGLPGNPMSSAVGFVLFVSQTLARLAGQEGADDPNWRKLSRPVPLLNQFQHTGDRPTYHPARFIFGPGRMGLELLPWHGSSDLRGAAYATQFAIFPAGERLYEIGEAVDCVMIA